MDEDSSQRQSSVVVTLTKHVQLIPIFSITATPVDDKDEEIDPEIPELGLVLEDGDMADDDVDDSDEEIDELDVDSL